MMETKENPCPLSFRLSVPCRRVSGPGIIVTGTGTGTGYGTVAGTYMDTRTNSVHTCSCVHARHEPPGTEAHIFVRSFLLMETSMPR